MSLSPHYRSPRPLFRFVASGAWAMCVAACATDVDYLSSGATETDAALATPDARGLPESSDGMGGIGGRSGVGGKGGSGGSGSGGSGSGGSSGGAGNGGAAGADAASDANTSDASVSDALATDGETGGRVPDADASRGDPDADASRGDPDADASRGDPDADASGSVLSFAPKADAYVRDGSGADTNFGRDPLLVVKKTTLGYNRESFLMFDLSGVASVKSAALQLTHDITSSEPLLLAVSAASSSWTEYGITWNNRPPTGAMLTTKTVWGGSPAVESFDVTGFVQSELTAGRPIISVSVSSLTHTTGAQFEFRSRDAVTGSPMLVIVP